MSKGARNTGERNQKCHCGSGKKYKYCCMEKDRETARLAELQKVSDADEREPEKPKPKYATWKVCLVAFLILLAIFGILMGLGHGNAGKAVMGVGLFCMFVFVIVRGEPPLRKHTGDGGNIDFGNRREMVTRGKK